MYKFAIILANLATNKEGIVRVKKSFNKPSCVFERIQERFVCLFVCFKSITDNLGVKILKSRGAAVEQLRTLI